MSVPPGSATAADRSVRVALAEDWGAVGGLFTAALHAGDSPETVELDGRLFEPTRSLLVTAGSRVVAHVGSHRRQLTVPGACVSAAHVALVAVAPDHRRQGLMDGLVRRQLSDLRDAGEPVAVLWASEGKIYPRFGYGLAVVRLALEAESREAWAPRTTVPSALRAADLQEAGPEVREVFERELPHRPGWSGRDERWWRFRVLADPPVRRQGATPWRVMLHEGPDGADGYAIWRVHQRWVEESAVGSVEVREIVTSSAPAYRALWGFLLSVDLTRGLRYPLAAPDEPLLYLVSEPRRLRARLADALWLRLTDLPNALAARRYRTPIDLVLDVTDTVLPANTGRWRLSGDLTGAVCEPTTSAADLACDISDLAAAYLGNGGLLESAELGRVRQLRPGALPAAQTAFSWQRRPSVVERF